MHITQSCDSLIATTNNGFIFVFEFGRQTFSGHTVDIQGKIFCSFLKIRSRHKLQTHPVNIPKYIYI